MSQNRCALDTALLHDGEGAAVEKSDLEMPSWRSICVHCERSMSIAQASELFSFFGEVAALKIGREPSDFVYVRFFENDSARFLLDSVAKDLQFRVERKSSESPYISPGTIITAWEVPVGCLKEVWASPYPAGLVFAPSSSCSVTCDRMQEGLPDLRNFGQAVVTGHPECVMTLGNELVGRIPNSEVIDERVLSGADRRSTIMVRNLPKKGKSSVFIHAIKAVDLWNRLSFYYMPFDKKRNRFCGFAFLDFKDPVDILRFRAAKFPEQLLINGPLGISYANLQGLTIIRPRFSDSLIQEEPDESKRPIFLP